MIEGIVAIVGRPNVGKSTLFNRMTQSDKAIVDDMPGVTRDRLYGSVWLDADKTEGFALIDTGGFETEDFNFQPFQDNLVWRQTEAAIKEADLVILLLDAKAGLHPHDKELHRYLEKEGKPYIAIANKVDGPEQKAGIFEFYELGFDEISCISAAHNRGVGDLKEMMLDRLRELPSRGSYASTEGAISVAIVGRPNAGKSSILNRLIGNERSLVSDVAGTTRDAVDTPLTYNRQKYVLVDTAGIRRKSRISAKLESLSVVRSIRAIERADVVLLVLDAASGLTDQDARLADLVISRHKPLAIVVNKWDLIPDKTSNTAKEYAEDIHSHLRAMAYVPIIFVSCLTNQRVHNLLGLAEEMAGRHARRVETSRVNEALRTMTQEHTPALVRAHSKRVKFYFATQVAVSPPTIVVFCNVADEIQESYKRYMANRFRSMLGFDSIPLRLIFRSKEEIRARDAHLNESEGDAHDSH